MTKLESLRQTEQHSTESIRCYHNRQSWCYSPHWHMPYEMIMVMENDYSVTVNGRSHRLLPGDLIIIPSGTIHEIIAPSTGERVLFMIDRDRLLSVDGMQNIEHCFYPCVLIRSEANPRITERFLRAVSEYDSSDVLGHTAAHMELSLMLIELARNLLTEDRKWSTAESAVKRDQNQMVFVDVCTFVAKHCTEDLRAEEIAKKVGYSKSYFEKMFAEFLGVSFHDFLTQQRLNLCKQSLVRSDEPIAGIAYAAGFHSIATFNRSFRTFEGMSPSEYRRLRENHLFDPVPKMDKA